MGLLEKMDTFFESRGHLAGLDEMNHDLEQEVNPDVTKNSTFIQQPSAKTLSDEL